MPVLGPDGGSSRPPSSGGGTPAPPTGTLGNLQPGQTLPPLGSQGAPAPAPAAAPSAASSAGGGWFYPTTGTNVSQGFDGVNEKGTDYGAPMGAPIYSIADGTVIASQADPGGFGWFIQVKHANGMISTYGHMYPNTVIVQVGQHVTGGQQIAQIGSNGASSGPHVELRVQNPSGGFLNPHTFLQSSGAAQSTAPTSSGGGAMDATAPAGAVAAGTTPATPKLDAQTLAETYGFSAAFFFSDPSLKTLIDQAVGAQWSTEQFMAHLRATPWYQQHADTERKWIAQWQADPSTGRQQLNQETQQILMEARQMGVTLTPDQAHGMADKALRFGLSPDLVKQGIASEYHYQQGQVSVGQSGDLTNTYQNLAGQYGVNLSPQTLQYWISQGLVGAGGTGAFQQYLKQTAKAQFPGLSQQLDAGMTVQQIADPYRQSMASLLEKSPDSINLQDPMLRQALAYKDPSAKPTDPPGVMPIWQFEDTVRQDPRWDQTTNAQQAAVRVAEKIGRDWGVFNA